MITQRLRPVLPLLETGALLSKPELIKRCRTHPEISKDKALLNLLHMVAFRQATRDGMDVVLY